jgi:putative tricarboxylic transport membrane protein
LFWHRLSGRQLKVFFGKDHPEATKVTFLKISKEEGKQIVPTILRGSFIGFLIGVLPGARATIASFRSYAAEKKVQRDPDTFGKGDVRGLAAPEATNNAACSDSFIPLLTLGQ